MKGRSKYRSTVMDGGHSYDMIYCVVQADKDGCQRRRIKILVIPMMGDLFTTAVVKCAGESKPNLMSGSKEGRERKGSGKA